MGGEDPEALREAKGAADEAGGGTNGSGVRTEPRADVVALLLLLHERLDALAETGRLLRETQRRTQRLHDELE